MSRKVKSFSWWQLGMKPIERTVPETNQLLRMTDKGVIINHIKCCICGLIFIWIDSENVDYFIMSCPLLFSKVWLMSKHNRRGMHISSHVLAVFTIILGTAPGMYSFVCFYGLTLVITKSQDGEHNEQHLNCNRTGCISGSSLNWDIKKSVCSSTYFSWVDNRIMNNR